MMNALSSFVVIPAKAGTHTIVRHFCRPVENVYSSALRDVFTSAWVPAFAGMTMEGGR
jgi:hypothetical protein